MIDPESENKYSVCLKEKIHEKIVESDSSEIFVFFAGKGIKHLHDHDEQTKISFEKLRKRFDFEFSPNSGHFGLKYLHTDEQISFFSHELFNTARLEEMIINQ